MTFKLKKWVYPADLKAAEEKADRAARVTIKRAWVLDSWAPWIGVITWYVSGYPVLVHSQLDARIARVTAHMDAFYEGEVARAKRSTL